MMQNCTNVYYVIMTTDLSNVNVWNSLLDSAISANKVNTFKNRLDG